MSVNYRSGSSCTHHDYDRNLTGLYWDVETSNQDNDGTICSEGKTTGEMKNYSTYVGWDFDNVWAINPSINEGYPYLKSESVELLAQSSTSFSDSGAGNGGETASSGGGGGSVDYGDLQINTSEKSSDSGKARQISTNLQEFFEDEDSQKTTFIILGAIILLVIIIALIVLFFKRKRYSNKNIPVEGKL
jgi:hypothetical protein